MSRLHKKCLIVSAAMHTLLVVLLVISPAFVPPKREPALPRLTFIPTRLTDDPFFGGGSTQAAAPSEPPATPSQPPRVDIIPPREPEPVRPEPESPKRAEPEKTPAKPKPSPKETKQPATKPKPSTDTAAKDKTPSEKPTKKPHEIIPTFKKSSDNPKALAAAKAKAQAEADARARARYWEGMKRVNDRLRGGLSSGTSIEMPQGPGGEAYANYSQVVISKYWNAWLPPDELADESATVKVRVVILRDGTVRSAAIVTPSGVRALNDSVRRALNLRFIAPFPEGVKDSERTFNIDFNPKIKSLIQ